MERIFLNFKHSATSKNFQKIIPLFIVLFALEICSVLNVSAQRRGGGDRGSHSSPSWHYSHLPSRGAFYAHVPHASARFFYGGHDFYFNHGIFYRPFHEGFVVVGPPFGLRIGFLPRGCFSFYWGGFPYYYYCGTYYVQKDGEYEVVAPPVGAVVESLPQGYEKVEVDGQTYYTVDGVQYKPVMKDGEIWYEVIKSPTKAPDKESTNGDENKSQ